MLVVLSIALVMQDVQVKVGKAERDSAEAAARRDSIQAVMLERQASRRRRPPVRIPVTPELERTAFRNEGARDMLMKARVARLSQDSSLLSYDATAYQRMSVGLGFRAIGRDRLLFRSENASRVRWSRANGLLIDIKGRRTAIPMVASEKDRKEVDVEMGDISPIPYTPGSEPLWVGVGSGMAKAEVDERELVHPIALGAEAYYRYEAGDSLTITLSEGRVIRLRELRIEPRRPEWKFSVGSFWFDESTGQLVRAVYRFSAPMNIWAVADEETARDQERSGNNNSDDEVPGWVKGMMSPMEANLEAVTIEYGLYGGRYWMPRARYAEGHAKAGFMRVPFKLEESFKFASVNGTDSIPVPEPGSQTRREVRDSLFGNDSTPWRDLPREVRQERLRQLAVIDSSRRASRRERREQECAATGSFTRREEREDGGVVAMVRKPCNDSVLVNSPDLPGSIYADGEELFGGAERDELRKALGFGTQAAWAPRPILLTYGLGQTRYNRVEGFSTALSATQLLGRGYTWDATARLGTGDVKPYGELGITRSNGQHQYRVGAYHRLGVANDDWGSPLSFGSSVSALFSGRDEGFYYRSAGVEVERSLVRGGGRRVRVFLEQHRNAEVETQFSIPRAFGSDRTFTPNVESERLTLAGIGFRDGFSRGLDPLGWRMLGDVKIEGGYMLDRQLSDTTDAFARVSGELSVARGFGPRFMGAVTASAGYSLGAPAQRHFFLGGAQTVRGQNVGAGIGEAYWLGRLELSRATGVIKPVVFGDIGWAGPWSERSSPGRPLSGAGIGTSLLDGLIRFDLSRGIYPQRQTRFDAYLQARF